MRRHQLSQGGAVAAFSEGLGWTLYRGNGCRDDWSDAQICHQPSRHLVPAGIPYDLLVQGGRSTEMTRRTAIAQHDGHDNISYFLNEGGRLMYGMGSNPILELEMRRHIQVALNKADQNEDMLVAAHLCTALKVLDARVHRSDIDGGDCG